MYFFKETRPLLGHFCKKKFCCPRKVKTLVKIFRIAKIGEKWLMTQNSWKWILNTTLTFLKLDIIKMIVEEWLHFWGKNGLITGGYPNT